MISNSMKQEWINTIPKFFINNIAMCDLKPYFNISLSKDIIYDMKLLDDSTTLINSKEYVGVTILPFDDKGKIEILISEDDCMIDIILHELTHMFDMVLFSEQFCDGKLNKVRKHKYYQTFIYWCEFHVKQIDIPYLHLLLDIYKNLPHEKWLLDFKQQINTFFYPKYNEKFLNKKNPAIRDVMWYLGELFVCNKYDQDNTYFIPQEIIDIYGSEIIELYYFMMQCLNFEDYAKNSEDFYNYFQ